MNRVELLCVMDRFMMEAFSKRTVAGLSQHTLFRLALPPFQSFLDINVRKEIEKDKLIIATASSLGQDRSGPGPEDVACLLKKAREIDESFVRKAAIFPINIRIQYQDIEHYRRERIEIMLDASWRILQQWQGRRAFRAVVSELYSEEQFKSLIHEILSLYAMETRMLSRSIKMPRLFSVGRDALTQTISRVMEQEAQSLTGSLTSRVFRRKH